MKSARVLIGVLVFVFLSVIYASNSMAAQGKIHGTGGFYGPNSLNSVWPNVSSVVVIVTITNRDNNPINSHIDFYNQAGQVVATLNFPQIPAHSSAYFITSSELVGKVPLNEILTPVIVWDGRVRVTPVVSGADYFIDVNNNVVSSLGVIFYDDSK